MFNFTKLNMVPNTGSIQGRRRCAYFNSWKLQFSICLSLSYSISMITVNGFNSSFLASWTKGNWRAMTPSARSFARTRLQSRSIANVFFKSICQLDKLIYIFVNVLDLTHLNIIYCESMFPHSFIRCSYFIIPYRKQIHY